MLMPWVPEIERRSRAGAGARGEVGTGGGCEGIRGGSSGFIIDGDRTSVARPWQEESSKSSKISYISYIPTAPAALASIDAVGIVLVLIVGDDVSDAEPERPTLSVEKLCSDTSTLHRRSSVTRSDAGTGDGDANRCKVVQASANWCNWVRGNIIP